MLPLGLFALCLSYLLPGHYPPWVSFQQHWLAALGAALVVLGVAISSDAKSTRWPATAWVCLATALVPVTQMLAGQVDYLSDGLLPGLYVAGFGLCVVAGASCTGQRRTELLDGLCAVFTTAGIASTALAAYQWLQLGTNLDIADLPPGARAFANLAQPNHLATLLALGVAALLRWYEVRRIRGWVALIGVSWLVFGMLMAQSRCSWLFAGTVPIAWAALHKKAGLRLRAGPMAAFLIAFVVALLLWDKVCDLLYLSGESLGDRFVPGARTRIWPVLIDAVGRAPWLGYGWNQVGLAQQAAALDHPTAFYLFTNSHNLFLDLMIWNGVPIGATLSALIVIWIVRRIRACNEAGDWSLLLALAAVFLHSMVEYPYEYAYFLFPAGLLVGALDGRAAGAAAVTISRKPLGLTAVLMMAVLGWIGIDYMKVEEAARELRFVKARIGTDRVSFVAPPSVLLLDSLREAHRFANAEARPGESADELEWMRTVAQHNASAPILFRYALAAGLNGQPERSSTTLALICKMSLPQKCAEGRVEWARMQDRYPALGNVSFPSNSVAPSSR